MSTNRESHGGGENDAPKRPLYDANGNRVNDFIPNFIANKPWYFEQDALSVDSNTRKRKTEDEIAHELSQTTDRLRHQRMQPDSEVVPNNEPRKGKGINDKFEVVEEDKVRRQRRIQQTKKIRRGQKICENCGSTLHSKRDCLEKPKKISYRYRDDHNSGVRSDDSQHQIVVRKDADDWDTKRDRWHGYDAVKDYDDQLQKMQEIQREREERLRQQQEEAGADSDGLDEDERLEMEELGLLEADSKKGSGAGAASAGNSLAADAGAKISVRSLDEKARYLEVIKTGEELQFNPKSRVYKDMKEGYLNEEGQFVRHITGEAEEFEKLKMFASSRHEENRKKYMESGGGSTEAKPLTDLSYAVEVSPTAVMLEMKKQKEEEEKVRSERRRQLLERYGATSE